MAKPNNTKKFSVRDIRCRERHSHNSGCHEPEGVYKDHNSFITKCVSSVSPTIKYNYPPTSQIQIQIPLSATQIASLQRANITQISHPPSKHGWHYHISPLRLHALTSSRCNLHHPLRADNNPPRLPAHQDPCLVSNTYSHRRSLYAILSLFPTSPHLNKAPLIDAKPAVEFIGYIGRAISSQQGHDWTIGPYIMQSLLILLAPAFFAASIYMSLARIIRSIGAEDRSFISPRSLTRIFVTGDVLSLFVVAGGKREPFFFLDHGCHPVPG